ncbi:hypothetical protein [Nocardioides caldifontis]|uniref:hypothetical protein n=1 Tax=Nocardioides caldifontis TaxID=2588938 RepID=UPI0011DF829A|nr:hypothetical protein [Nocardioides caldifontis]
MVDTTSRAEVREAIATLSSVWGGRFMPILDRNAPVEELRRQGRLYDVDALYAEDVEGPLADFLREPGWAWAGRGEWGPFAQQSRFRKGLLPINALVGSDADFVQPRWESVSTSLCKRPDGVSGSRGQSPREVQFELVERGGPVLAGGAAHEELLLFASSSRGGP